MNFLPSPVDLNNSPHLFFASKPRISTKPCSLGRVVVALVKTLAQTTMLLMVWTQANSQQPAISSENTQTASTIEEEKIVLENLTRTNDTLQLREILRQIAATHPGLLAAKLDMDANQQSVEALDWQYWPQVAVVYERNIAGNLTNSTASQLLRVQQPLWDFGLINSRIDEAEKIKTIASVEIAVRKQDLFLQAVAAWQSIFNQNSRLSTLEESLQQLQKFDQQMQNRVAAEASPRIDLELVRSRILQIQVEMDTNQITRKVALTKLENLSSQKNLTPTLDSDEIPLDSQALHAYKNLIVSANFDELSNQAPNVIKARAEADLAAARIKLKRMENLPQIYARLDTPISTASDLSLANKSVYIGLSYSSGAGLSSLAEATALETRLASVEKSFETIRLSEKELLENDRQDFLNNLSLLDSQEKLIGSAQQTADSYSRQFFAGRKSWSDLINAHRELLNYKTVFVDTQAALLGAIYRLKIRMGETLN